MKITSKLGKRMLVATLLAGVGLPATLANAQFKVEYDSKAKPEQKQSQSDEMYTVVINSNDDNHTYELKIINGEIKVAKVDGKQLDDDQVKFVGESVIFLSSDGKKLNEFVIKGAPGEKGKAISVGGAPTAMTWVTQTDTAEIPAAKPRVMLGINLTEPSDAVRKQLNLGDDQQAIFVERVIEGLPAKKAGLEDYDVIISIDGSDYANGELLSKVLREKNPGDALKLVVLRGGEKLKLKADLQAYSAEKLGVPQATELRVTPESDFAFPGLKRDGNAFVFGLGPEIHEQIMQALHASGLNDEQVERVQKQLQEQLHEHMNGLNGLFEWNSEDDDGEYEFRFFGSPDAPRTPEQAEAMERHRIEVETVREQAAMAQEKARAAMRDAKRQVMELRDGQLIVRQADELQDHLDGLEDRLDHLEEQLEDQMEELGDRMERLGDLLERLIDRLEERD
ncbi:MAG: PDZ domain-containing protein [Phycisphaerales bacterium]|nr:PDZ domain-containing protein [Phycisphaerales bacterium]